MKSTGSLIKVCNTENLCLFSEKRMKMRLLSLTLMVTQWRNPQSPPKVKRVERRSAICRLFIRVKVQCLSNILMLIDIVYFFSISLWGFLSN